MQVQCTCGSWKVAEQHYHSGERLYTFMRCEDCLREWTEGIVDVDPRDAVTADEVLTVHEFFKQFDEPLKALLNEQE